MSKFLDLLTPWRDKEEEDMKQKRTDAALKDAKEATEKTLTIVDQYRVMTDAYANRKSGGKAVIR